MNIYLTVLNDTYILHSKIKILGKRVNYYLSII